MADDNETFQIFWPSQKTYTWGSSLQTRGGLRRVSSMHHGSEMGNEGFMSISAFKAADTTNVPNANSQWMGSTLTLACPAPGARDIHSRRQNLRGSAHLNALKYATKTSAHTIKIESLNLKRFLLAANSSITEAVQYATNQLATIRASILGVLTKNMCCKSAVEVLKDGHIFSRKVFEEESIEKAATILTSSQECVRSVAQSFQKPA